MEFPVLSTSGNFTGIAVESMKGDGEVQLVYNDNELILGAPDDFGNITDLVLEDGTRAMIVNGTLVTADGQTLILQDGSDLSQYSVNDNTDEIVISKEAEDQFLEILLPQDQNIIQYVKNANITHDDQQIYVQDGDSILPLEEQHQLADFCTQSPTEPMQIIKLENQQMLNEVGDVIDLEQLLLSQQEPLEYQYAVLKNLQGSVLDPQEFEDRDVKIVFNPESNSADCLGFSAVKGWGRNIKTGQVITLPGYVDKAVNRKRKVLGSNKKDNCIKNKCEDKESVHGNLKRLINKKITIGKTEQGQTLIGKIVNVLKKSDKISMKQPQPIRKTVLPPKKDEVPVIDLTNNSRGVKRLSTYNNNRLSKRGSNCLIQTTQKPENSVNSESLTILEGNKELNLAKSNGNRNKENEKCEPMQKPSERSKLIVQKKIVSKDCFDMISRTLQGLMNMDSVVKKLKNRTIIIKIIQKLYNQTTKDYSKTVSYCSGYMVREYKLDDQDSSFSETWKFIPDSDSKETILGQDSYVMPAQDCISNQQSVKRFVNLTIQITISQDGNKTLRVIINPPALFQCKACFKSFRTSALLKVHSLDCHAPFGLDCAECSVKFKTVAEAKEHSLQHQEAVEKGMYECVECNESFPTPTLIRKHMDTHFVPFVCSECHLSFPSTSELNKHMQTHADPDRETEKHSEMTSQKQQERQMFSCPICSRQFSRHSNLQRHIEIHQGEGAMYQCAVCSCSYHYISSLTRHVVSSHLDKSKKPVQSADDQTKSQGSDDLAEQQEFQFFQDNQVIQMIPLESLNAETLEQYMNENMECASENFQDLGEGVQILQIPMDSSVVVEDH